MSGGRALSLDEAVIQMLGELYDVMERIQQQLGQINNNNNLAPGERFIE